MNYMLCQITPMYFVKIQESRYAEFAQQYWFSNLANPNAYLQQCIAEGWVKNEV